MYKVACLSSFALLFVFVFYTTLTPTIASTPLNIYPPEANPYGLSYSEYAQNFWKWLLSIPADQNPIDDTTGKNCMVGQTNTNSSVFYLSAGAGKMERTCTVPAGKGLLIPVMQVEISDKELPGASVQDLANAAKKDQGSLSNDR